MLKVELFHAGKHNKANSGFPQTAKRTPLITALNGVACSTSWSNYFPLVSIRQKADWPQR